MAQPAPKRQEISPLELHRAIAKGLPFKRLEALVNSGRFSLEEAHTLISPRRTLARRKQSGHLNIEESDRLARLIRVIETADGTLGNSAKTNRWLRTANGAIDGHRPLDLCSTDEGARLVEALLGRIAHGVYG